MANNEFNAIYSKHKGTVMNYLNYKGITNDIANEICNDVFMKVHKSLYEFNPSLSIFKTWLFNITKNCIIDYYRSKEYKKELKNVNVSNYTDEEGNELFSFVSDSDASKEVESIELMNSINKAFITLKPKYRQIADLFFIQELSHAEICEICSLPLGSVKGMISRCKEMLQVELKNVVKEYSISN